jgi:multiple sugar transport system ATP-binding protein
MNFLAGTLIDRDDGTVFRANGGFTIHLGGRLAGDRTRPVILGIRPEHLVITADGTPTEIVIIETTGSATQVNLRSGSDELVCEFRERVVAQPGDTLRIAPLPNTIHLFDAQSGHALDFIRAH